MAALKHLVKRKARGGLAWLLHTTGLRRLFRAGRRGVPVLMFHNVGHPAETDYIPGHMKFGEERLEQLLGALERGGDRTMTLGELVAAFERGELPKDRVVLTFDDGYRDNHDKLLPLLQRHQATATVFVQTGPMRGRVNWLHHYFWVLHRIGPHEVGRQLAAVVDSPALKDQLSKLPDAPVAAEYQLKRLLKYEVSTAQRDELLAQVFHRIGGDDRALAASVWLGESECRALDRAGVELGAHTVNHLVLSSLTPDEQRREIDESRQDLERWLGHPVRSFAYPYGRSWDYNADTVAILRELGFASAITAMPGLNDPRTDRMALKRVAVSEEVPLAEVLCEVDGVFDWLERKGIALRT